MHAAIVIVVFGTALGVSVATILNTIGERFSRPEPRPEVFHHDCAAWYYPDAER